MALQEDVTLLSALPCFAFFSEEALRLLAFSSDSRILRPGDVLFRSGQPAVGAYLVRTGAVMVVATGEPGETIVGPGGLIGEAGLIAPCEFRFTAVARDASSVLHIPRATVRKVLQEYPDVAAELKRGIEARLVEIRERMIRARSLLEPKRLEPGG